MRQQFNCLPQVPIKYIDAVHQRAKGAKSAGAPRQSAAAEPVRVRHRVESDLIGCCVPVAEETGNARTRGSVLFRDRVGSPL